jgi:very-short-patch-repair endonuclease
VTAIRSSTAGRSGITNHRNRTRAAFERDRARDAALRVAGHRVLRITYRRLKKEREAVIAQLRALLSSGLAA